MCQTANDLRGYWAGGNLNAQGGQINFARTVVEDVGELSYNASNWVRCDLRSSNTSSRPRTASLA